MSAARHEINPFPEVADELRALRDKVRASVLHEDIQKYIDFYWKARLYPYQEKLANLILNPPETRRVAVQSPRQAGKSTTIIYTILYLLDKIPGFKIGVFAPKQEQAKDIIFKGVRDRAKQSEYYSKKIVRDSATHLELSNGSFFKAQPASPTSKIMGFTLHLAIVDEAQEVPDYKIRRDIQPMLSRNNGTLVLIGTAYTNICYFYEALRSPAYTAMKIDLEEATAQNADYAKSVELARLEKGEDDVLFRTQFKGEWVLEKGMYIDRDTLEACQREDIIINQPEAVHFAGFDPACKQDRSVFTIFNDRGQIVKWVAFDGDEFPVQYQEIVPIISAWNIKYLEVDASGPQAEHAQMIRAMCRERGIDCAVEGRKFDPMVKHQYANNFRRAIANKEFAYPSREILDPSQHLHWARFVTEMLALEMSYRDYLMVVAAPEKNKAHDDYWFSAMLGWAAYSTFNKVAAGGGTKFIPILSHDRRGMRSSFTRPGQGRTVFRDRRLRHGKIDD